MVYYYQDGNEDYAAFFESNEYKEYLQQIKDYKKKYYYYVNNNKINNIEEN